MVAGATGFTGRLVAEHLAVHYSGPSAPTPRLRWALAGRDRAKLERLRSELAVNHPQVANVPVLAADPRDTASLELLVGSASVFLSLAGPYARYGTPVVNAALRARTHYLDITAEHQWMRANIDKHHEAAKAAGVCVVHSVGYDSVPWDLGTLLAVQALRDAGVGANASVRVDGLVGATAGGFSGGTVASLLDVMVDPAANKLSGSHSLDPEWAPRPDRGPQLVPAYNSAARRWTLPSIMAFANERTVNRSAALQPQLYGPRGQFSYKESTLAPSALGAYIGTAAMALGALLISLPPTRYLLAKTVLPAPGEGPSLAVRESGFFTAHFVATSSDGQRAYSRVALRGADPGCAGLLGRERCERNAHDRDPDA